MRMEGEKERQGQKHCILCSTVRLSQSEKFDKMFRVGDCSAMCQSIGIVCSVGTSQHSIPSTVQYRSQSRSLHIASTRVSPQQYCIQSSQFGSWIVGSFISPHRTELYSTARYYGSPWSRKKDWQLLKPLCAEPRTVDSDKSLRTISRIINWSIWSPPLPAGHFKLLFRRTVDEPVEDEEKKQDPSHWTTNYRSDA